MKLDRAAIAREERRRIFEEIEPSPMHATTGEYGENGALRESVMRKM
jgi:hypothetical protein